MKKHRIDKRLIKGIGLVVFFYVAFVVRILSKGKLDVVLGISLLVLLIALMFWVRYTWKKVLEYDQLSQEEKAFRERNPDEMFTRTGALIITSTAVVTIVIAILIPEQGGKPAGQLLAGVTCAIILLAAIFGRKKNDRS